jgi:hypothetical protein
MIGRTILFLVVVALPACNDPCPSGVFGCEVDEQCGPGALPPGRCLDDHESGKVCAFYFHICPTKLQWMYCAGANGKRSSWAGRCVRPEFIPGFDASTPAVVPDMSINLDGGDDGGPS